ncbi:MAG: hypothetical protein K6L75_15685 [Cellvibrionaceae bacterium]
MDQIIKDIPKSNHSDFLEEFLSHYVDKQGLGGMSKPDLDALIIYLYTKYSANKKFDAFELGQRFMIKESRIKSLYETGLIKYSGLTEGKAWIEILTKLKSSKFELESNEKSQIRFKFENPALYKFFQKRLRVIGGTAPYSRTYETVTISLEVFFELLEHVYDSSQTQFATAEMDVIHTLVEPVIKKLGSSLGKKKLQELQGKEGMKSKAGKTLRSAGAMSGIGRFVLALL